MLKMKYYFNLLINFQNLKLNNDNTVIMRQRSNKKYQKRPRFSLCYYSIEDHSDDQESSRQPIFERMPLIRREQISKIKFKNVIHSNNQPIYEILSDLYQQGSNPQQIYSQLAEKRINPNLNNTLDRDDLEYFIPQIVTYLVIEKNLEDSLLLQFLINGCTTDFYFAHRVYFYLNSLSANHQNEKISNVCDFISSDFFEKMKIYQKCKLSGAELTKSMIMMDASLNPKTKLRISSNIDHGEDEEKQEQIVSKRKISFDQQEWDKYGTKDYPNPPPQNPKPIPKVYKKKYIKNGFMETPKFWQDMIDIGTTISETTSAKRDQHLSKQISLVNERLPANVYIPFFKDHIRMYTILCVWKGRLFATKQRAPYSIWVEMYREEQQIQNKQCQIIQEQINEEAQITHPKTFIDKLYETISRPFSINGDKNTLNIRRFITDKLSVIDETIRSCKSKSRSQFRSFVGFENQRKSSISEIYEDMSDKLVRSDRSSSSYSVKSQKMDESPTKDLQGLSIDDFFPPKSQDTINKIKNASIYRNLKSWRVLHLMIKTGDDIKQEQFAMQLINRFQYIFKRQKINCTVFPYEVITIGPDCGLIEMLNDVTTLDKLFEKLSFEKMSLRSFFNKYFPDKHEARKNFIQSLAGYSLICYFLQIKDRHNGNILLHRDGSIIHIDFGFFLSNAPGKGVELEGKLPFKFLTQYVEVMGGLQSEQFFEFRQLFYRGFAAILKHKDSIITLVKMMYSSHGEIMSCFIKGQLAIYELEKRFSIEENIQSFCYDLINSSLDNWRARWYDKFQYFLQKIYY